MAVNYFAGFNPDALDPNKALVNSLYQGAQLQGVQAEAAAQQQKALQLQQARELEGKRQLAVQALLTDPSPQNFTAYTAMFPEHSEAIKRAWDIKSEGAKNDEQKFYGRVYSTLDSGNAALTKQIIDGRIEAIKNGNGDKDELHVLQTVSDGLNSADPAVLQSNMRQAQGLTGLYLASIDDKWASSLSDYNKDGREAGLYPSVVAKARAEAREATTKANYAQDIIEADLEDKQSGIELRDAQIQNYADDAEYKRATIKLRALEAKTARANNALERQKLELQVEEQRQKLATMRTDKQAEIAEAGASFDTTLATLDKLAKHPGLSSAVGLKDGTQYLPGTDAADFNALLKTFDAQAFLSQVDKMRGLGALTDKEGPKLSASIATLTTDQSEASFKKNLGEAITILNNAKARLASKQAGYNSAGGNWGDGGQSAATGKTYSRNQVAAWAKSRGIDVNTAIQKITESGGQVK